MKFKRMFFSLTFAIGVIMGSAGYVAAADFHIDDGAPDYWMSPGIIAQQTYQDPPTVFESVIAGQSGYVWISVFRQYGFDAGPPAETATLRVYVGQNCTSVDPTQINSITPNADWSNVNGNNMVPLQWSSSTNPPFQDYMTIDAGNAPSDGGSRWYVFNWQPDSVPPTGAGNPHYCLLAWVESDWDDGGGTTVPTNDNAAERRFIVLGLDFGDAPDPAYPTLLANNGASHVATGPMLGAARDSEIDGKPTATADGDDANSSDDEDGIVFFGRPVPNTIASVDVTVSAFGLLNAWVDFNMDGDWSDADEQIFTDQALPMGVNSLNFNVPAWAVANTVPCSRFRFSTAGGLSFTGPADDGEVEDHLVEETSVDVNRGSGAGCFIATAAYGSEM